MKSDKRHFRFGFRVVGSCEEARRTVDWCAAFQAHAACDERAKPSSECYLSAFQFSADFRAYLESTGSTKGFAGPTWAEWIWFDIDREDIGAALTDSRRLAVMLTDSLGVAEGELLAFYSGRKGFHLGIPSALWSPSPGPMFHKIARRFCEGIAGRAGVVIDPQVYVRVQPFRAPNSRHSKTGLHKRWVSFDELMTLSSDAIVQIAAAPSAFEIPEPTGRNDQLAALWTDATEAVNREAEAAKDRQAAIANGTTPDRLNRATLDFIRDGATQGDRHRMLFSAAANLTEFGCPLPLALALLTEAGLDSGLKPSEVKRQIECGHAHAAGGMR